jgi:LemA protein
MEETVMNKGALGCGIFVALLIVIVLVIGSQYVNVWNALNTNFQTVNGARSQYSAALNTCSQKIQGVWEIANQYMKHESSTFKGVAEARSGYKAAKEAYDKALAEGKDTSALTEAGTKAVNAALAFQIQIEAYPQLKASETTTQNIRNMEESVNEIKTSLDDWIVAIKEYNTYRGSAWPSVIGSFMRKFPAEIKYYEGKIQELDINKLNPEKQEK